MSPAPTVGRPAQSAGNPAANTGSAKAPVAVVPFTRAARKKSMNVGVYGPVTLNTGVNAQPVIPVPAAGYLRWLEITVTGTTAGNAATVAFNADGPFNVLQQISFAAANGDSIISPIDGFSLYLINKSGAFSCGFYDPVADPSYSLTVGAGATGGSFQFVLRVPLEIDSRDGLGALENMAANQAYQFQYSLNNLANLYTVAPTSAPTVTVAITEHYWNAPAPANLAGAPQAQAPNGNGTVSLIQTQSPSITANSTQTIPLLNVGNTVRWIMFVLRNNSGVRVEADFPAISKIIVNNDTWYYKRKEQWRSQLAKDYLLRAGITASPTAGAQDNGVFILDDFINDGAPGAAFANASSNRNLWMVTNSATSLQFDATTAWGANGYSLQVIQNNIRPSDPAALYGPSWI
jgi:hypothetical protein